MHSEFPQDSGLDAILTRARHLESRMVSAVGEILLYRKSIFMDCLHLLKEFCNLFHVKLNNSEGHMYHPIMCGEIQWNIAYTEAEMKSETDERIEGWYHCGHCSSK